jgi:hypothetical protein
LCSKASGVDTPPTLLFFPKDSSAQSVEPNEPLHDSEKQERTQGNERKEIARRIIAELRDFRTHTQGERLGLTIHTQTAVPWLRRPHVGRPLLRHIHNRLLRIGSYY